MSCKVGVSGRTDHRWKTDGRMDGQLGNIMPLLSTAGGGDIKKHA